MVADTQSQPSKTECRGELEGIAHLTAKVCSIWGTAELDTYLSGLLMDARDGARRGLPVPVAEEVLFLAQTNKLIRAMDLAKKQTMPLREAYRMVDEGDQVRLRIDALDDPSVSRDTITRASRSSVDLGRRALPRLTPDRRAVPRGSENRGSLDRERGFGVLLLRLGKWLLAAIVLLMCLHYVWPILMALI